MRVVKCISASRKPKLSLLPCMTSLLVEQTFSLSGISMVGDVTVDWGHSGGVVIGCQGDALCVFGCGIP